MCVDENIGGGGAVPKPPCLLVVRREKGGLGDALNGVDGFIKTTMTEEQVSSCTKRGR